MHTAISHLSKLSRHWLPGQLDQSLREIAYRFGSTTFSQEGEDMVLNRYFEGKNSGFYVDVGAHHPFRFSNTYLFFRKGWKGINIDAAPGAMRAFERFRKKDINLESGIGAVSCTMPFFIFDEPALSTFDPDLAQKRNVPPWKLIRTVDVAVAPLGSILEKHLPAGQTIDFLSIDVEGRDLEVIQSNDWTRFRPQVVLIETMSTTIENLTDSPHHQYLGRMGYAAFAKSINTSFYVDTRAE